MREISKNTPANLTSQKRIVPQVTLQSSGDGIQQIAYAQNVNTNNIFVVSTAPAGLQSGLVISETVGKCKECYHLVVLDDTILVGENKFFTLKVSTANALMKNTSLSLMQRYARLGEVEIEELISYPALFVYKKKNKEESSTASNAHFGVIYGIRKSRDYVLLDCMLSTHFNRERLKTIYKQLEINNAYFVDELCVEHWALKESDLFETLHAAYIPVGF